MYLCSNLELDLLLGIRLQEDIIVAVRKNKVLETGYGKTKARLLCYELLLNYFFFSQKVLPKCV